MFSVVIAFPQIEDAAYVKNILIRNGYENPLVCTSGAQAISLANEQDCGVVITGYRLADMYFRELSSYLPKGIEMLLLASPARLQECVDSGIVSLGLPIKTQELLATLQMMMQAALRRKKKEREKPRERNEQERERIRMAKLLLMERNNMSEEEAHRYIQKTSMDSGTNMAETAEMILSML